MSQPKFAAITSSLLARKGEARPWAEPGKPPLVPEKITLRHEAPPAVVEPQRQKSQCQARADAKTEWKKYVLRLTHRDYERLGLLAIKQGKTRQRLLQDAVDGLFTGMSGAYGGACACLGDSNADPLRTPFIETKT